MNCDKKCHERYQFVNEQLIIAAKEGKIEEGDTEKVQKLLSIGANPNSQDERGFTALIWASHNGQLDTVRLLLENKADVNLKNKNNHMKENYGETALIMASSNGHLDVVYQLLKCEHIDINLTCDFGQVSALMFASMEGHIDIVRILCDHNANVNLEDEDGQTALTHASIHEYLDIVKLLKNIREAQIRK